MQKIIYTYGDSDFGQKEEDYEFEVDYEGLNEFVNAKLTKEDLLEVAIKIWKNISADSSEIEYLKDTWDIEKESDWEKLFEDDPYNFLELLLFNFEEEFFKEYEDELTTYFADKASEEFAEYKFAEHDYY